MQNRETFSTSNSEINPITGGENPWSKMAEEAPLFGGGEKVGYAYREEPDANFPNDSGWRFLAGIEDNGYSENPNNFNVFEINTICNYDNAILPILKSEIGSSFTRKGDLLIKDNKV